MTLRKFFPLDVRSHMDEFQDSVDPAARPPGSMVPLGFWLEAEGRLVALSFAYPGRTLEPSQPHGSGAVRFFLGTNSGRLLRIEVDMWEIFQRANNAAERILAGEDQATVLSELTAGIQQMFDNLGAEISDALVGRSERVGSRLNYRLARAGVEEVDAEMAPWMAAELLKRQKQGGPASRP